MLTGGQKNETSREEQTLSPGSLNGSIRLWEAGLEGSCTGGLGSSERLLQDPRAPAWLAMDLAGGGAGAGSVLGPCLFGETNLMATDSRV